LLILRVKKLCFCENSETTENPENIETAEKIENTEKKVIIPVA